MGQVFTFARSIVVEYRASQNATLEQEYLLLEINPWRGIGRNFGNRKTGRNRKWKMISGIKKDFMETIEYAN